MWQVGLLQSSCSAPPYCCTVDVGQSSWSYGYAYLLEHEQFKISAWVRVQLPRDTKLTKELGHKNISDSDLFLIWKCERFWPFTRIFHRNEDVLVTLIGFWQRSEDINGNTLHGLRNMSHCSRDLCFILRPFLTEQRSHL